jgi:hypothetical protein
LKPGILFITSADTDPTRDIMQDTLHEGLDEVLGAERVYCYPYKDYSQFQYNLTPMSAAKSLHRRPVGRRRLADWRESIAAVVVGSVGSEALRTWEMLSDLFPNCPVALIVDQWSPGLPWPTTIRFTHRFIKDLLPEGRAPGIYALTYAAPSRVMMPAPVERDIDVSFVARNTHPLRTECAQLLEEAGFQVFLDAAMPREQFCGILNRSRVAVSIRGASWDSMRYWEIPYHGALLLSQRLPVVVPDNFVDGESAVFFDHPADMMEKIQDLVSDRGSRLEAIAASGMSLCREKHTAAARARYLLQCLGLGPALGLDAGS